MFTHIFVDNTTPILEEESAERGKLSELGIDVGRAGLEIEL
jgi:pyrroloquinoline quinone biosynthesis protein B